MRRISDIILIIIMFLLVGCSNNENVENEFEVKVENLESTINMVIFDLNIIDSHKISDINSYVVTLVDELDNIMEHKNITIGNQNIIFDDLKSDHRYELEISGLISTDDIGYEEKIFYSNEIYTDFLEPDFTFKINNIYADAVSFQVKKYAPYLSNLLNYEVRVEDFNKEVKYTLIEDDYIPSNITNNNNVVVENLKAQTDYKIVLEYDYIKNRDEKSVNIKRVLYEFTSLKINDEISFDNDNQPFVYYEDDITQIYHVDTNELKDNHFIKFINEDNIEMIPVHSMPTYMYIDSEGFFYFEYWVPDRTEIVKVDSSGNIVSRGGGYIEASSYGDEYPNSIVEKNGRIYSFPILTDIYPKQDPGYGYAVQLLYVDKDLASYHHVSFMTKQLLFSHVFNDESIILVGRDISNQSKIKVALYDENLLEKFEVSFYHRQLFIGDEIDKIIVSDISIIDDEISSLLLSMNIIEFSDGEVIGEYNMYMDMNGNIVDYE